MRIIIAIIIIFSISYWLGYYIRKEEEDYLPICFVAFCDSNEDPTILDSIYFFGYTDAPYTNDPDSVYCIETEKGIHMYFILSQNILINEAKGRKIMFVVNMARFSKRNNTSYMRRIFNRGIRFYVQEKNRHV